MQWVHTVTAELCTICFEQASQVSGRLGLIRESWWAGIERRGRIATTGRRCHGGKDGRRTRPIVPMRIAFFGLPLAALLLDRDGHRIEVAVLSRSDAPGRRRLARRLGSERVLLREKTSEAAIVARLSDLNVDLLVSWFYTRKITPAMTGAARLGGIGVHPSLLPRHRGADPYFAAIDQGDRETGVTAHRILPEYDTGPMLGQRRLTIDPRWSAWQLARALDRPSLELLRATVGTLARGEALDEVPQDERLATSAPPPSEDDCVLRWSWTTERLLHRMRALSPAPGAWTDVDGHLVVVHEARRTERFPRVLAPGEAAVVDGVAVVRTQDGAVELLRGEVDDAPADAAAIASVVARARRKVLG